MRPIEELSTHAEATRQRPGVPDDVVMEDLAEELSLLGEVSPPVDLPLLASLQSIGEIDECLTGGHSGCLINDRGRLRIEVSALDRRERQRFTIGHEICHTMLPGFTMQRNFRCTPGRSSPGAGRGLNIEWLADVGASELLLPRRFAGPAFADAPFGWDSIEHIAATFEASLEATARRFVRLSPSNAIFASLTFATSRANPIPELRVASSATSPRLEAFIPINKSIPRDHPAFNASLGEDVDTVVDMTALRAPGPYRINARPYPINNSEGETTMRVLLIGIQQIRTLRE